MSEGGRSPSRTARHLLSVLVVGTLLAALLGTGLSAGAVAPTPLPVADGSRFVGNLSAPSVGNQMTGTIDYSLADPLPDALSGISLTFGIYAVVPLGSNQSLSNVSAGSMLLTYSTQAGGNVTVTLPTLASGVRTSMSLGVVVSADAPSGTYAVRTLLTFSAGGEAYVLKSRGWFSEALWEQATELPNGSATLNLTVLNVSGVLPETAVYVPAGAGLTTIVLGSLAVATVAVAGLAAYFYFRRGPGSSSGASGPEAEESQAPSALGASRSKDGD